MPTYIFYHSAVLPTYCIKQFNDIIINNYLLLFTIRATLLAVSEILFNSSQHSFHCLLAIAVVKCMDNFPFF